MLGQTKRRVKIPLGRIPQRLPELLSRAEVAALLDAPMPIKARTFLMTAYASGLRINELCHLRGCAIGFVTPAQRHAGLDGTLLEERALVCERARQENPQRWSGQPRQWARVDVVHRNPDTPQIKEP